MLLNNEWVKNESKEEVKKLLEIMKMNSQQPKLMGHSKGSPEKEVHGNTGLPTKDRNISTNNLTLCLQELEEQQRGRK